MLFLSARIARSTANLVASSNPLYSWQVIVVALGGAGTSGVDDVLLGADVVGRVIVVDGRVDVEVEVPGWVVIATLPAVVRSQPLTRPMKMTAAKITGTCVLILATLGARAT